ncbi:hypothetical protein BB560_000463 [Smittium megazygosporum]|uniref:RNA helicase n=1 Tax=Smittium megazygosporum TaxID=133381 RepID=A0A2T9ZKC0_9FUNG|nr:hypothetical protein BB560_000463 [Smittium megazygosporum]
MSKNQPSKKNFTDLDLDDRLLKALGDMKLVSMTPVQEKALPFGLAGKDLIVQARTGSGKTAVFGLIILNNIVKNLGSSETKRKRTGTRSIVIVPTLELCEQITRYLRALSKYTSNLLTIVNAGSSGTTHAVKTMLYSQPEIIVSTPSKLLPYLKDESLNLCKSLEALVIDESDLVLSFGYKAELMEITGYLPKNCQKILTSATLPEDVEEFSRLVLRNPIKCFINDEMDNHAGRLAQYAVMCNQKDKFLYLYVILKLKLISGKCIIFVNGVDRCYRVKLFLEQFSIKSCVLNSELPINSRFHIVEEFNRDVYDYIIATDEASTVETANENDSFENSKFEKVFSTNSLSDDNKDKESDNDDSEDEDGSDQSESEQSEEESKTKNKKKTLKKIKTDLQKPVEKQQNVASNPANVSDKKQKNNKNTGYGVVRGIDFKNVAAVINFDFPATADGYTHRIGRTARGTKRGMSLSFVVSKQDVREKKPINIEKEKEQFEKVKADQKAKGCTIEPYEFDYNQISSLRYRCEDAERAVTRVLVKEAKQRDLKREIVNSKLLKTHFEDRPADLNFLRHDRTIKPAKIQPHMKNVPSYLLPKISTINGDPNDSIEVSGMPRKHLKHIPFDASNSSKRFKSRNKGSKIKKSGKGRSSDPLRSFGAGRSKRSKRF